MSWRDRVKEMRRVPTSDLLANPKNWREHPPDQKRAMEGVLEEVGIAGALLARETPAGLELIDGHLRTEIAEETEWPVLILDVDESEADILLASIDPIGAMARRNDDLLKDLLESIEVKSEGLAELLGSFDADMSDWVTDFDLVDKVDPHTEGIPTKVTIECQQVDLEAIRSIVVEAVKEGGFLDAVTIK